MFSSSPPSYPTSAASPSNTGWGVCYSSTDAFLKPVGSAGEEMDSTSRCDEGQEDPDVIGWARKIFFTDFQDMPERTSCLCSQTTPSLLGGTMRLVMIGLSDFLPYLFFRSCNNFLRFLDFWSNGGTCQMQIVVNAFLGFCLRPTYTWLWTQEDLNILKAYYSEVYSRHRDCNEFHMVSALLLPHTTQYCNAGVAKENCPVFKSQH